MRHTYIIALLLVICSTASAQVYQRMPQYGYQMPRAQIDSVLQPPSDTVRNKTGVVRIGTQLYAGNGTYWAAATIDTTDIRYRPTAGDGISITGTYPSQTIAGNPDTLIAGANITLSPSGTKKVTIAANTASLDSLYGGKLDSVVKRGDTLWAFAGGDSTLIGVISGGGGGTLQEAFDAAPTANPQINTAGNNFVYLLDNGTTSNNLTFAPDYIYSSIFNTGGSGNEFYSGTTELIYSKTPTIGGNYIFRVLDNLATFYTSGNDSVMKVGINTYTPSSALHVVGAPRFATDSAQAGYVWTSKDATGQGEWRVISGGGGGTLQEAYDNSTAPQINTGTGVFNVVGDDGINIADFGISADQTSISHTLNNGSGAGSKMQITPQLFAATIQNHTGNATEFMIDSTDAYFFNAAYPVNLGINTRTPTAPLHVVGGIICDSTRIGNDWFYTKKVTLSSTDILNGATNGPFLAIDAPGAGKAIQIISASQYYFFNTTAYSNGADFALKHGISFPQLMNFPVLTNNGISFGAIGILNLTPETFMENEPIYIVASSDDADGDGTTSFYIYYRIINL